MVTSSTVASDSRANLRPIIEDAFTKILSSIDCQNIYFEELPPITSNEELFSLLRVSDDSPQGILEAWFFTRDSISNNTNNISYSRYPQVHEINILGMAYHNDFHNSYQYIQDKTETLMWTLEKNKNFISSEIDFITVSNARFSFEQFGELYLYRSETTFDVHRSVTEADGRSFV